MTRLFFQWVSGKWADGCIVGERDVSGGWNAVEGKRRDFRHGRAGRVGQHLELRLLSASPDKGPLPSIIIPLAKPLPASLPLPAH